MPIQSWHSSHARREASNSRIAVACIPLSGVCESHCQAKLTRLPRRAIRKLNSGETMTNVEPVGSTPVDIESLRCDYDHFHDDNPELRREQWKWLRAECPVAYSSAYNGFVLLTKYEDVYNTLVDTETFTSTHGVGIPRQPMTLLPEDLDPPIHRKYRSLINPPLAPQQVAKHEL